MESSLTTRTLEVEFNARDGMSCRSSLWIAMGVGTCFLLRISCFTLIRMDDFPSSRFLSMCTQYYYVYSFVPTSPVRRIVWDKQFA